MTQANTAQGPVSRRRPSPDTWLLGSTCDGATCALGTAERHHPRSWRRCAMHRAVRSPRWSCARLPNIVQRCGRCLTAVFDEDGLSAVHLVVVDRPLVEPAL